MSDDHILDLMNRWQVTGFCADIQNEVLSRNDPELAYRFACEMPESDLALVEEVILTSPDHRLVFDFAILKSERGAEISRLQERILNSETPGLMILFAADIEGADIEAIRNHIERLGDSKYLHLFDLEMQNKGYE